MRPIHPCMTLMLLGLLLIPLSPAPSAGTWFEMDTGSIHDLLAVWGTSDDDLFAAGEEGTLLHYNGTYWQDIDTGGFADLNSLWGIALEVAVACGDDGSMFLYNGYQWLKLSPTIKDINAVWGASSSDIHAVGSDGLFLHYDGLQWRVLNPGPTGLNLYSLWGSGQNDVYAGGELGTILHYDGDVWSVLDDAGIPTSQTIRALWGESSTEIFAAGTSGDIFRYDGSTWSPVANTGFELYTLWGSGADNVFAAGESGKVYHYDGNSGNLWEEIAGFTGQGVEDIHASWGSTSGRVYFTGSDGRIFLYAGEDHIPPQIIAVELSTNNEGRAYVPTEVVFHFSEGMDPASITGSTVTFMQGSAVVGDTVDLSDSNTSVTLTGSLQYDTAYRAVVRGGASGVKDGAAPDKNALEEDFTVTFTTEEPPTDDGGGVDGGCFISSALSQAPARHQAMIRMPWAVR